MPTLRPIWLWLLIPVGIALIGSLYLQQMFSHHAWQQSEKVLRQVLHGIVEQITREGNINQQWIRTIQLPKDSLSNNSTHHFRLTIISSNGTVLADNHGIPQHMDNHLLRPEIKAALASAQHVAVSRRRSRSIGMEYLYIAQALYHNKQHLGFVRLAMPRKYIEQEYMYSLWSITLPFYIFIIMTTTGIVVFIRSNNKKCIKAPNTDKKQEIATDQQVDNNHIIWQQDHSFHLSEMLNSLSEGIIAINKNEAIVYINRAAAHMLRMNENDILGTTLWDSCRINIIPETVHACLHTQSEISREFQVLQQIQELHYTLHATPIFQDENDIYGAVAIIDDTSDRQRLESMRRNFFTNISHELKTPLALIHAVIETMIDDPDMDAAQRHIFLQKSRNNCGRLSTLVGDILTISRLEELHDLQEPERISLSGILRDCVQLMHGRAEHKHIIVEMDISEDPCYIEGDRELMHQVYDNLLSNAINYSPENSRIQVNLHMHDTHFILRIIDHGPGIPPQFLERIFERFYRVDKARSRQLGGTGLGLSIAKHAVALHNGQISVHSEISQGCTFTVRLPTSAQSSAATDTSPNIPAGADNDHTKTS